MNKNIKVSDLYLKAYLAANNINYDKLEVENVNGKRNVNWIYKSDDETEDVIKSFRDDSFIKDYIREYLISKREITKALNDK